MRDGWQHPALDPPGAGDCTSTPSCDNPKDLQRTLLRTAEEQWTTGEPRDVPEQLPEFSSGCAARRGGRAVVPEPEHHFKGKDVSISRQVEKQGVGAVPDRICQNFLWHLFGTISTISGT